MRYIAFLRGINVGGHIVKMERLRELFSQLGFQRVATYIQSGNVFFTTDEASTTSLATTIEEHLEAALGFPVPVFLRTVSELRSLLALEPFQEPLTPETRFCIMFLTRPAPDLKTPIWSPKHDAQIVAIHGSNAFIVWHIVNGRPPAIEKFLKQTLGSGTTRFFHTAQKILAAAERE